MKENPKKYEGVTLEGISGNNKLASLLSTNFHATKINFRYAESLMNDTAEEWRSGKWKKECSHIKISFSPDDKDISDEKMVTIGKEVLRKLQYNNSKYVMFRHVDEPHPHLHIVTSTKDENGIFVHSKYEGIRAKYIERDLEDK